jgi:hypothetical protein
MSPRTDTGPLKCCGKVIKKIISLRRYSMPWQIEIFTRSFFLMLRKFNLPFFVSNFQPDKKRDEFFSGLCMLLLCFENIFTQKSS